MSLKRTVQTGLWRSLPAIIALLIWEGLAHEGWLNPFILPAPTEIFRSLWHMALTGELWSDSVQSLIRVLMGFAISIVIATPLGLWLGLNRRADAILGPIVDFFRPIPPIAWIPLAVLWFGIGNGPSYFLTMIASFFPILLNTYAGVKSISPEHFAVARCFEAPRILVLRKIVIPATLPFIFSGFRIGLGIGWMAVVAAEMIAAQSGLGYMIHVSQDMLETSRVIAGMLAIGIIGLVLDFMIVRLQKRMLPWMRESWT